MPILFPISAADGMGFYDDRILPHLVQSGYMKGPRPMTFMYEGSARLT